MCRFSNTYRQTSFIFWCSFPLKKKKLFCAFTDYKKAFDSVDRAALWHKLLRSSVDGKSCVITRNMHAQAKSGIKVNGCNSEFFKSSVGVRQGEY